MSNQLKSRGRPKKPADPDKLVLRIDLEKNLQDDFFKVKESQGLTNNTEVIRFCIREIASSKMYRIPETTFQIIEDLVSDRRIQEKYIITSVDDFISRSIRQFIMQTRKDRANLHDWEYRADLKPTERDVANILITLQGQNNALGSTYDQISKELPNFSESQLQNILDSFVTKKLIRKMESDNQIYYYAIDRGFIADEPISEIY